MTFLVRLPLPLQAMQQLEEQSKDYREHIRTLNEKVKDLEDVKQSLLDTTKELEYEHIAYQQLEVRLPHGQCSSLL